MRKKWKILSIFFVLTLFMVSCDSGNSGSDTDLPQVVSTIPAIGATNVNVSTTDQLIVTFNKPMSGGYSYVIIDGGYTYPVYPADISTLTWNATMTTITVTLNKPLQPDTDYGCSLNSESHTNFKDQDGNILTPVEWTFTTGPQ